MKPRPLTRGDILLFKWGDITASDIDDTNSAGVSGRINIGFFWEYKESMGIPCIVITNTLDAPEQGSFQQGFLCVPQACIIKTARLRWPWPNKGH